jgi:hypothetical protein
MTDHRSISSESVIWTVNAILRYSCLCSKLFCLFTFIYILSLSWENRYASKFRTDYISTQEKRGYYLLLSFITLTALTNYREVGAINFSVSNNILNIVFLITQVQTQTLNTYAHSPLWTHVYKPYPYEYIRNTVLTHLEIDKVTAGALLSTGTSPIIERTTSLNSGTNQEKYEHPYQVDDLNPGGQVPPQGT